MVYTNPMYTSAAKKLRKPTFSQWIALVKQDDPINNRMHYFAGITKID